MVTIRQMMSSPILVVILSTIIAVLVLLMIQTKDNQDWMAANIKNIKSNKYIKNIQDNLNTVTTGQNVYINDSKIVTEERFKIIMKSCGDLCDFSIQPVPSYFMDTRRAKVDCRAIFLNEEIDKPHEGKPPKWQEVSKFTRNVLTHGNKTDSQILYFDEAFHGGAMKESNPHIFTEEVIDAYVGLLKDGKPPVQTYPGSVEDILYAIKEAAPVKGKHALVIGSQTPWLEAILIYSGISHVTTLEYGNFVSKHPRMDFMRPDKFRKQFLDGSLPIFDMVFTYSSVEHSGLGRYGDAQNPWGDILTISRAWCASSPNAKLIVGVPVDYKKDCIVFNAHRYYGPILYPYLVTNWKFNWASERDIKIKKEWIPEKKCVSGGQPVYVFTKLQNI